MKTLSRKHEKTVQINLHCMAESQGFEPWVRYHPTHDFQSCALDHSANSPKQQMLTSLQYSGFSGFVKL